MIELLSLYAGALVAGVLCAMALALHGCHMASRGLALHSLIVSQAAIVGVLLGSVLEIHRSGQASGSALPLVGGITITTYYYYLIKHFTIDTNLTKTHLSILLFIAILTTNY